MSRLIFITGTDTGAGKTVLAVSLVKWLRSEGVRALGMKPFCSGSRDDVKCLQSVQAGELSDEEVNPFYFAEAVAPLVSARRHGRRVALADALQRIRAVMRQCDVLVVEGSGGLMVPLGDGYLVADVIKALRCEVVVAARNQLGVINHALLTVEGVKRLRPKKVSVVVMDCGIRDASTGTNREILSELLAPVEVVGFPFFGREWRKKLRLKGREKILEKVLAGFGK